VDVTPWKPHIHRNASAHKPRLKTCSNCWDVTTFSPVELDWGYIVPLGRGVRQSWQPHNASSKLHGVTSRCENLKSSRTKESVRWNTDSKVFMIRMDICFRVSTWRNIKRSCMLQYFSQGPGSIPGHSVGSSI
jgi:hypothetical protein